MNPQVPEVISLIDEDNPMVIDISDDDFEAPTAKSNRFGPAIQNSERLSRYHRVGLHLSASQIDITDTDGANRWMTCVEIRGQPNEFLLILQVVRDVAEGIVIVRGLRLQREEKFNGYFRHALHRNELVMVATIDRDDLRPWFDQGAESFRECALGRERFLNITDQRFPIFSYHQSPYWCHQDATTLESNGPLACRRMVLNFWNSAKLRSFKENAPSRALDNGRHYGNCTDIVISWLIDPAKEPKNRLAFPWMQTSTHQKDSRPLRANVREMKRSLKDRYLVDICCGAGGASIGARMAGFQALGAVDIDKSACLSYEANLGTRPLCADISQALQSIVDLKFHLDIRNGQKCLVLHWSAPCQGLSPANTRQAIDDPRRLANNDLQTTIAVAIKQLNPSVVTGEQTKGILTHHSEWLDVLIDQLVEDCGYNVHWKLQDLGEWGNVQQRKRFLFLATK
jgi:DNA (cytosine-5)-methyltransferase 1